MENSPFLVSLYVQLKKKKLKFSKGAIIYSSYEIKENSLVCTKEKGKQLYEVISIDNPSK